MPRAAMDYRHMMPKASMDNRPINYYNAQGVYELQSIQCPERLWIIAISSTCQDGTNPHCYKPLVYGE